MWPVLSQAPVCLAWGISAVVIKESKDGTECPGLVGPVLGAGCSHFSLVVRPEGQGCWPSLLLSLVGCVVAAWSPQAGCGVRLLWC